MDSRNFLLSFLMSCTGNDWITRAGTTTVVMHIISKIDSEPDSTFRPNEAKPK